MRFQGVFIMEKFMRTLIGSLLLAGYLFLSSPQTAHSDVFKLEWDKVTTDTTGAPLTVKLSGYKIYVAQTSGNYGTPTIAFVAPALTGTVEKYTYTNVVRGTYFAVVTAYNSKGESGHSNEITFTVLANIPDNPVGLKATKVP